MAQQYYDMLMTFMSQEAQAYAENNLRELWKWLSWLYDNAYIALDKKARERLDKEYEEIEEELYKSTQGDKINDLWSDNEGDLAEYRRQLKRIRGFRRELLQEMQQRGMILPWEKARDLGKAGVSFDAN